MRYLQGILGIWLSYLGLEAFWRYTEVYQKMGRYGAFYIIFHALMLLAGIGLLLRAIKGKEKRKKRQYDTYEDFL